MTIIWEITRISVVWGAIYSVVYGITAAIVTALVGGDTFFIGNFNRWWGFWLVALPAAFIVFTLISGMGFIAGVVLFLQLSDGQLLGTDALDNVRNTTNMIVIITVLTTTFIWLAWWKEASLWIRFWFIILPVFSTTSIILYMIHRYLQRLPHI